MERNIYFITGMAVWQISTKLEAKFLLSFEQTANKKLPDPHGSSGDINCHCHCNLSSIIQNPTDTWSMGRQVVEAKYDKSK